MIVDAQGRVLLVKHGYGELNWQIPGGLGEPGESAEETAHREAREEAGVELEALRLTGVYWEPDHPGSKGMHHFVFRATLAPASPAPSVADKNEITDVGWFDPKSLPRPMSDFTEQRIADALANGPAVFKTVGPRVWLK